MIRWVPNVKTKGEMILHVKSVVFRLNDLGVKGDRVGSTRYEAAVGWDQIISGYLHESTVICHFSHNIVQTRITFCEMLKKWWIHTCLLTIVFAGATVCSKSSVYVTSSSRSSGTTSSKTAQATVRIACTQGLYSWYQLISPESHVLNYPQGSKALSPLIATWRASNEQQSTALNVKFNVCKFEGHDLAVSYAIYGVQCIMHSV